jgi:hypothetical protein
MGAPFWAPVNRERRRSGELESGWWAVTEPAREPAIEDIIEQLQTCILDARALKLEMLEHILSIALLEAYVARGNRDKED